MDRRDVRMIELGRRARLALEARQGVGVPGQLRGQELERHAAAQLEIEGLVHLAHPAPPDQADELVMRDAGGSHQRRAIMVESSPAHDPRRVPGSTAEDTTASGEQPRGRRQPSGVL